jgi:hypothetical protein
MISPLVMRPGGSISCRSPASYALAAAALADDADHLAREHVEADTIDSAHGAFVQTERHAQIAHP